MTSGRELKAIRVWPGVLLALFGCAASAPLRRPPLSDGPGAAMNAAPLGGGGRMAFGGTPEADARAAQQAMAELAALVPL